jgi:hypothetical protein
VLTDEERETKQDFLGLKFHQMMTAASRLLRKHEDAVMYLERTEREGLRPIRLEEDMRVLLRDDPVSAIDAMTVRTGSKVTPRLDPQASPYDFEASVFSDVVYLRMKSGSVENPLTGRWSTLAAFVKTGEWAIRGEDNRSASWLRIKLPEFSGSLNDQQELADGLHKCQWATVRVEDLLKESTNKFFLPRRWNKWQWISRRDLQQLLDQWNGNKNGEMS